MELTIKSGYSHGPLGDSYKKTVPLNLERRTFYVSIIEMSTNIREFRLNIHMIKEGFMEHVESYIKIIIYTLFVRTSKMKHFRFYLALSLL